MGWRNGILRHECVYESVPCIFFFSKRMVPNLFPNMYLIRQFKYIYIHFTLKMLDMSLNNENVGVYDHKL